MKRRIISLLLVLAMVFAMAGCGNKTENKENKEQPKEQEKTFSLGTIDGNVYTNDFAGFSFKADDDWVFLDDEEIADLTGIVMEKLDNEEYTKSLSEGKTLIEMYSMPVDSSGRSINVTVQDVGAFYGKTTTLDAFISASIDQLKVAFESIGATDAEIEPAHFDFIGTDCSGLTCKADFAGTVLYESQVSIKVGRYIYSITCGAFSEEDVAAELEMFCAL